jgi:hypothetical protein
MKTLRWLVFLLVLVSVAYLVGEIFGYRSNKSLSESSIDVDKQRFSQRNRIEGKESKSISRDEIQREFGVFSSADLLRILEEDGLEAAWKKAGDQTDEIYRHGLQRLILIEMAKNGRVEEVLEFVQENVGLGHRREDFVYQIISRSSLSFSAALELCGDEGNAADEKGLLRGFSFLVMKNGVDGVNVSSLDLSQSIKISIAEGLAIYLSQKNQIGEAVSSLENLSSESEIDKEITHRFIGKLNPQVLKQLIRHFASTEAGPSATILKEMAYQKMAIILPEWVIQQSLAEGVVINSKTIEKALIGVANLDPNQAVKLLGEVGTERPELRSTMLSGLSKAASQRGEFDAAREWVDQIESPELQRKVEGNVWQAEKRSVDLAAKHDPAGVIGDIVSGDSVHADYWIKEAFGQWAMNAPEEAASWYEDNRKTMSPSQMQHVARVYAEQAIESGDLNLAKQWVGEVIEEKFTAKLQEKIREVEAARN